MCIADNLAIIFRLCVLYGILLFKSFVMRFSQIIYEMSFSKYTAKYRPLNTHLSDKPIPVRDLKEKLNEQRGSLRLKDEQVDYLLQYADENENGFLTPDEFSRLATSRGAQRSNFKRALYAVADQILTQPQQIEVHSYIDEYTLCPPPIFILLISLLQVIIFFFYYWTYPSTTRPSIWDVCAGCYERGSKKNVPGVFIFVPSLRTEAWRYFTYSFVHSGLVHLIANVIMQVIVGLPLEIVHKMYRIGPLYILAVISGALVQYVLDPRVQLVGCSAGVYALILAHLANVFINWSEMPFRWIRLVVVAVYVLFDVGSVAHMLVFSTQCEPVSHFAHLAGAITGVCFGLFILYNIVEHKWEKILRYVCLGIYTSLLAIVILLNVLVIPDSQPFFEPFKCKD